MNLTGSFFDILFWTWSKGANEFLILWLNIHWFIYRFFSVPQMLSSLFSPLKRLKEGKGRGFDPQIVFESFILNTVMRITGFLIRIFLLCGAAVAQVLALFIGAVFFAAFILWPAVVIFSIYYGFSLIMT